MMLKIFLLILSGISFAGEEPGGNSGDLVGNGGDGQVIEFRNLGLGVAEKLLQLNGSCQTLIPLKPLDLIQIVYRAGIESSEKELILRGSRVEAINYPAQSRIIFHLESFDKNQNKKQFVVHEFLGLLRLSDEKDGQQYGLSKFLVELADRPECQRPLSQRRWTKKIQNGERIYFQFGFPSEVIPYNLSASSQESPIAVPAGTFSIWKNNLYFASGRGVCGLQGCIEQSTVSGAVSDFGFLGDRLVENVTKFRNANDYFSVGYDFENLHIADLSSGESYSLKLETSQDNSNLSGAKKYRYSQIRNIKPIGQGLGIGIADEYEDGKLSSFSLVRFEWSAFKNPLKNPTTDYQRVQNYIFTNHYRKNEKLNLTQKFIYPVNQAVPQEIYPVHQGQFVVTDDGSVYETSRGLLKVAVLEAPIADVAEYGDYTIALSNGRVLIYDQKWHLQGEFNASTAPQGLAVNGETVTLFSMLTDQQIFAEKHDVNDFFKKKRSCLMSEAALQKFAPSAEETFLFNGSTFALSMADGCVLKLEGKKWQRWLGLQKNSTVYPFLEKGVLLSVSKAAAVYSVDILDREETLVANFNTPMEKGEVKNGALKLRLRPANFAKEFIREVVLTPEGRIVSDRIEVSSWGNH
jgi:hypothetical protein